MIQARGFHQCSASAVRASRCVTASPRSTCPSSCSSTTRRRSPLHARASSGSKTVGRSTPKVIGMPDRRLQHLNRMLDPEAAGKRIGLVLIGRNSRRTAGPPEQGGGRGHLQQSGGKARHPQQHQGVFGVDGACGRGRCRRAFGSRVARCVAPCGSSGVDAVVWNTMPGSAGSTALASRTRTAGSATESSGRAISAAADAVHTMWRAAAERLRRR